MFYSSLSLSLSLSEKNILENNISESKYGWEIDRLINRSTQRYNI